jgi:pyridinium-3,5-bisthiocarboxylic acid mononucleotide nickel chelatase
MRIAYLDCFSGISGDMFLGALIEGGVSARLLEETVAALDIGARLEIRRVLRGGIGGTKVDVYVGEEKDLPREVFFQQSELGHGQKHSVEKSHLHSHGHAGWHDHKNADPPYGRGLNEIRGIIRKAAIGESAKATAIRIFEALAGAEAGIHETSLDDVHFHEVGAVDAMVDIVCAAVGAEALGVDEWVCSPLNVGGGSVQCAHGTLLVPAPATVKLLAGAPVYSSGPQVELATPTGAAIVKTLAARFGAFPAMKIARTGYGAGTRDFPEHPNLLRLTVGEASDIAGTSLAPGPSGRREPNSQTQTERIAVLEANLDDLSPQIVAYAMERLLAEGALDVFSVPLQMKKSRMGALLTVLAKPQDSDRLTKVIFAETTTLGVRRRDEQRQVLERRWETVETSWGPVRMKVANLNGTVSNYAPEFEDCRRIASERNVPLKEVMQEALTLYQKTADRKLA